MATFSYTTDKKFSMGNRIAYSYSLSNVQTSGSIIYTPFKKITGYLIETTSPGTSQIIVASNNETTGHGVAANLTFAADAESQGKVLVVGLL